MAVLTLEQILAAKDTEPIPVEVTEWGGEVNVYPLTCSQLDEWEQWQEDNPANVGWRLKMLSLAMRMPEEDVRKLEQKSASAVTQLANIACNLCTSSRIDHAGN